MLCIWLLSEEARYVFWKKSCADFNFISLIYYYVYIHIALCHQDLYLQDSCSNNLAMPHSVSWKYSSVIYALIAKTE